MRTIERKGIDSILHEFTLTGERATVKSQPKLLIVKLYMPNSPKLCGLISHKGVLKAIQLHFKSILVHVDFISIYVF